MQLQINTDNHIKGREALIHQVEAEVEATLGRFSDHLTRIEIHLGDENAGKSGTADKRCMMEARLAGQPPVVVTHHAATLGEACAGAAQKLKSLLDSRIGRQQDQKRATSSHGDDS